METTASWLADGVKEIAALTKKATTVKPEVVPLGMEKAGTYALLIPGIPGTEIEKQFQPRLAGPAWHREQLSMPSELSQFIKSLQKRRGVTTAPDAVGAPAVKPVEPGVILVEREAATYFYSFEDRRDEAFCPLKVSVPWAWLSAPTKALTQRELIRVLRIVFAGCLPTDSLIVNVFRNLKFNSQGEATANLQRGNEALGRRISNEVAGATDLPEEVTLTLPVYENYLKRVSVRVAIEVNPEQQTFELIAFPNELENGRQETLRAIRDDVAFDSEVPAFLGINQAK